MYALYIFEGSKALARILERLSTRYLATFGNLLTLQYNYMQSFLATIFPTICKRHMSVCISHFLNRRL